jgi:hypothetical protein
MEKFFSNILIMSISDLLWAKKIMLLLTALILVNTVKAQKKPVHEEHALSEKMVVPAQVQMKPDITLRSSAIDLGDGMSLLGSDVDPNSTLLTNVSHM